MGRPIKFRAWNKLSRKMDYSPCLYKPNKEVEDCLLNEWIQMAQEHMNGVILMQFTGLHDKNGKEIWEGDVVTNGFRKGTVFVDGVEWGWGEYRLENKSIKSLEVLGNIYENSELLNGK